MEATTRPVVESNTPFSTSGVFLISMMCGSRDRSGTRRSAFCFDPDTGPALCAEVSAVSATEDDTVREEILGDIVVADLGVLGVD